MIKAIPDKEEMSICLLLETEEELAAWHMVCEDWNETVDFENKIIRIGIGSEPDFKRWLIVLKEQINKKY